MEKPNHTLEFEKPVRQLEEQLERLRRSSEESKLDLSAEVTAMEKKLAQTRKDIFTNLTPWQKVQLARHPARPYSLDYIERLFTDFQELHGDRLFRDDRAIIGGTAFYNGEPVVVIAQQKGRDTKENLARNFGYPNPEGYRKALRLMKLAERFQLPVITLIDTPGAFPGIGAEERHVAEAIAVNLREMALLRTPVVSLVIGEGGSGGALGIAVADAVLILENAYYSVIAPESCATILWKDRTRAAEAAESLQITAERLHKLGVVDEVVPEPMGGAHNDAREAAEAINTAISRHLKKLRELSVEKLLEKRYEKFRAMGVYAEEKPRPARKAGGGNNGRSRQETPEKEPEAARS